MSKELDELERGILEFEKDLEDDCNNEWLKRVVAGMKKCYHRLEAIDNANPSEAMRCLINFVENNEKGTYSIRDKKDIATIKQALLKAQEDESRIDIEVESKKKIIQHNFALHKENAELKRVLEIVKEKNVDVYELQECKNVEQYNKKCDYWGNQLTQEEFDLLKKILGQTQI